MQTLYIDLGNQPSSCISVASLLHSRVSLALGAEHISGFLCGTNTLNFGRQILFRKALIPFSSAVESFDYKLE